MITTARQRVLPKRHIGRTDSRTISLLRKTGFHLKLSGRCFRGQIILAPDADEQKNI